MEDAVPMLQSLEEHSARAQGGNCERLQSCSGASYRMHANGLDQSSADKLIAVAAHLLADRAGLNQVEPTWYNVCDSNLRHEQDKASYIMN